MVCQGSPAAFRMHESLVIGCRGYSSQTVGLNIRLWDDGERGHLWPSRRVITKVTHSSHIWEDVDRALEMRSTQKEAKETENNGSYWFYILQTTKHLRKQKENTWTCDEPSVFEGIVRYFGKLFTYSPSCRESDEKISLSCMYDKYEATASSWLA